MHLRLTLFICYMDIQTKCYFYILLQFKARILYRLFFLRIPKKKWTMISTDIDEQLRFVISKMNKRDFKS